MRVLIVADIHANLAAFTAVLKHERGEYDEIYCLGDLVGYGPRPNECVDLVRERCSLVLGGNHDLAAGGIIGCDDFSRHARLSMRWTLSRISGETRAYLASLPARKERGDTLFSHGGPENPIWSYILSQGDAECSFQEVPFKICIFGHTHIPSAFVKAGKSAASPQTAGGNCQAVYGIPGLAIETREKGLRVMLNPGSVGFPRDAADAHSSSHMGHAAARYAVYDTDTGLWVFKRTEYNMKAAAQEMVKAGLW
jgi:predicted phosphodiesterase